MVFKWLLCSDTLVPCNHYLDFSPQFFFQGSAVIRIFKWEQRHKEPALLTNRFSRALKYLQSYSHKLKVLIAATRP